MPNARCAVWLMGVVRHLPMNEQLPAKGLAPCAFACRAMTLALIIGLLSIPLTFILCQMKGRWDVIFASSGALCAASLGALLFSIKAIGRWRRGPDSYVAVITSGLAFLFWCCMIVVFISVSHGGE